MDLGLKIAVTGLVAVCVGKAIRECSYDDIYRANIISVISCLSLVLGGIAAIVVGVLMFVWG